VSQSAGHHIANNKVFSEVVGQIEMQKEEHTGSTSSANTTSVETPLKLKGLLNVAG